MVLRDWLGVKAEKEKEWNKERNKSENKQIKKEKPSNQKPLPKLVVRV